MSHTLTINGDQRQSAATNVTALLAEEGVKLDAKGVAVALNGAVVRKLEWGATPLTEGDTVEIVKPFSGG